MKILCLALMMLCGVVSAGDSGIFYDYELNGEGVLLMRDGDRIVIYMFTYGGLQCPDVQPDENTIDLPECDLNGQRWFFGTGDYEADKSEVSGVLGVAEGLDYPFGVRDKDDPFRMNVGEPEEVGKFILRRSEKGWRMFVEQTTRALSVNDPLFDRVFEFQTKLFDVDETVAEPK